MDNPASVYDVESRWRPLSEREAFVAEALIRDAWTLLNLRVPALESRLEAIPPTLDVNLVKMVLAAMATRVLRNLDGKRQETIEDYSYTLDPAAATGLLTVTVDEIGLLAPVQELVGAFTITPFYEPGWTVDEWWG